MPRGVGPRLKNNLKFKPRYDLLREISGLEFGKEVSRKAVAAERRITARMISRGQMVREVL